METFGSFQELGNHVKGQIAEDTVNMSSDEGNIYHYIIESLKSKPRGLDEIIAFVSSRQFETKDIEIAVQFMRNNGVLSCSAQAPVVYWLTIPYSQLKNTAPHPATTGYAPRKHKEPPVVEKNPNTTINRNDNIDVAIFKAMQDHKPRSASEIAKILVEYGYDSSIVKNRVITLMKRKTWFDRQERGGKDTTYTLKKTRTAADDTKPTTDETNDSQESVPQSLEDLKGTVFYKETHEVTPVIAVDPPANENPKEVEISEGIAVQSDDPVIEAIWKVVQDHQWYTASDIITLLEAANHFAKASTIRSQISVLKGYGWFKERAGKNIGHKRTECYLQLYERVRHPKTNVLMSDYVPNKKVSASKEPNLPVPAPSEMGQTSNVVNKEVLVPTSKNLFEYQIFLKGVAFTMKEFNEVLEFIQNSVITQPTSLIEVQCKIKGVEFTGSELKEILKLAEQ